MFFRLVQCDVVHVYQVFVRARRVPRCFFLSAFEVHSNAADPHPPS